MCSTLLQCSYFCLRLLHYSPFPIVLIYPSLQCPSTVLLPPLFPWGHFLHQGTFYQLIKKMIKVNARSYPMLPHVWPSVESFQVKNISVKLLFLSQLYAISLDMCVLFIVNNEKKKIVGSLHVVNHHILGCYNIISTKPGIFGTVARFPFPRASHL